MANPPDTAVRLYTMTAAKDQIHQPKTYDTRLDYLAY